MFKEDNKFSFFMLFLTVIFTLFFISLKTPFIVSLIVSLLFVAVIRFCWFLFNILWKLLEVRFDGSSSEGVKKFKG